MAFDLPYFFDYPPCFTYGPRYRSTDGNLFVWHRSLLTEGKFQTHSSCRLQPIQETRKKQSTLWQQLILSYCRHHKVSSFLIAPYRDFILARCIVSQRNSLQVYKVSLTAEELPIFVNQKINSASCFGNSAQCTYGIVEYGSPFCRKAESGSQTSLLGRSGSFR